MSLSIEGLTVSLGGEEIIHALDLEVHSGERFAIMGPSGSGKSTLLRTIAGLVSPTAGSIRIDDADITSLPTHQRPIGLMFQDHALFPHLSVGDNVGYGLRMAGVNRSTRGELVAMLLERVGLAGMESRRPDTLSGGEQQRVALARTIALEPSVVMFDEPLGSLDVALRDDLLLHIRSIVDQVGTTSLYVTHDSAEAFSFASRLAVIHDGRVVTVGTPDELWSQPGSVFVARMVGHVNVVDGDALGLGSGMVTIPEKALTIDREGSISARVIGSAFDDGRYRIRVDIAGTTLTVPSDHSETAGASVPVRVDHASVIRLST
jgi:ABC-type Fe3+/spermidine/putrescine transport system ATPase subunit